METNTMTHEIEVIIDNGGGLTVQCDGFVHAYDGSSDEAIAKQAAADVAALLKGEDPSGWDDGNEPDCRINYTADEIRNGGYWVLDNSDLRVIVETENETRGGYMGAAFAQALRAAVR
jgi:hypothetical protein